MSFWKELKAFAGENVKVFPMTECFLIGNETWKQEKCLYNNTMKQLRKIVFVNLLLLPVAHLNSNSSSSNNVFYPLEDDLQYSTTGTTMNLLSARNNKVAVSSHIIACPIRIQHNAWHTGMKQ